MIRYIAQLRVALASLVLFVFTSNLFWQIPGYSGVVGGLYSDYLIPKLYLSDLLITALVGLAVVQALLRGEWGKRLLAVSRLTWVGAALWLLILAAALISQIPLVGLLGWWRLSLAVFFGWQLYLLWPQWRGWFIWSLAAGLVFISSLGLYQWLTQSSLAGYWLLGEPNLSTSIGLAKSSLGGAEKILPYATLPHPNVFGAVAALVSLVLIRELGRVRRASALKIGLSLAAGLGVVAVFLSHSISASLVLILGAILLWLPAGWLDRLTNHKLPWLAGLLAIWLVAGWFTYQIGITRPLDPSWYRRAYLLENSFSNLLGLGPVGTGVSQATTLNPGVIRAYEAARFNQPVHHLPSLILMELGWLGTFGALGLLSIIYQRLTQVSRRQLLVRLIILSPIIVWDHFLWSLPQGQLLGIIFLSWLNFNPRRAQA